MPQSNVLPHSMEVISNIQLLHECKRDRDHDLFQLVNKPVATKNNDTSRSCGDAFIDNVDEMIALLDTTVHLDSSLVRDNSQEPFGTLFNQKSEYFETTIAHVIECHPQRNDHSQGQLYRHSTKSTLATAAEKSKGTDATCFVVRFERRPVTSKQNNHYQMTHG